MDPRVRDLGVTADDLVAQETLALAVRDLLSRARRLEAGLAAEADSLEAVASPDAAAAGRLGEVRRALARLRTVEGIAYPQPMLLDQIGYLYGMVARGAQRPGSDAFRRYEELVIRLDGIEKTRQ